MSRYIAYKRFRQKAISGNVNIPFGTELNSIDGVIYWGEKAICYTGSENAHQYFSINDDGKGLERGKLTQQIQNLLTPPLTHCSQAACNKALQAAERLWDAVELEIYRRSEHQERWLWNQKFFDASIEELNHILTVISGH